MAAVVAENWGKLGPVVVLPLAGLELAMLPLAGKDDICADHAGAVGVVVACGVGAEVSVVVDAPPGGCEVRLSLGALSAGGRGGSIVLLQCPRPARRR
jgi:hypothetical protein